MRGIEHQLVGDRAYGCDLGKQALPDTALGPPVVAVVDRGVRAVRRGRILPAAADLQHMQDAADHPPVVDPRFTRLAVRQMWLDPRPGFIQGPEQPCHRDPPALKTSNSGRKRKRQQLVVWVPSLASLPTSSPANSTARLIAQGENQIPSRYPRRSVSKSPSLAKAAHPHMSVVTAAVLKLCSLPVVTTEPRRSRNQRCIGPKDHLFDDLFGCPSARLLLSVNFLWYLAAGP